MLGRDEPAGQPKGLVFDIQRFAVHDGPGIRTVVFLKGCPLSCVWCHNPESISFQPEVSFVRERCIACGLCVAVCQRGARRMEEGRPAYDRGSCVACGRCADVCPTTATERVGEWRSIEEVWNEVALDRPFFRRSGGGLTISGGEPLAQFEFTLALAQRAKAEGIHVCFDTCGYAPADRLREIVPLVDLFLYDVKDTDSFRHKGSTGVANEQILANLQVLDALGCPIALRCPMIPGLNLRPGYLEGLAGLAHSLTNCVALHLMPYHELARSKHARIGIDARAPAPRQPEAQEVEGWLRRLQEMGVPARPA